MSSFTMLVNRVVAQVFMCVCVCVCVCCVCVCECVCVCVYHPVEPAKRMLCGRSGGGWHPCAVAARGQGTMST